MKSLARSLSTLDGRSLLGLQKAAEREATRRASARSLIDFSCYTNPRYEPAGLHRQIAEQLERVERGEIDRLMLLVPPRHGKSELASRRFPAWYLGRHPEQHFISASASFALAEDFGRDVRNLMKSEEYAQVFDVQLAEDSQARGRWNTQALGCYSLGRSAVIIQKMVRLSIRLRCELRCRSGASLPKMSRPLSLGGALSIRS